VVCAKLVEELFVAMSVLVDREGSGFGMFYWAKYIQIWRRCFRVTTRQLTRRLQDGQAGEKAVHERRRLTPSLEVKCSLFFFSLGEEQGSPRSIKSAGSIDCFRLRGILGIVVAAAAH
jgi:hypothetical protein